MSTTRRHTSSMASRSTGFTPPPHENAEVHRQVMERLNSMDQAQFVASTVEAGIYTRDGQLTAPYRPSDDGKTNQK